MASVQRLTHADVGAWVFKGNPDRVWDYLSKQADTGRKPSSIKENTWTLGGTYRTHLVEKDDLVVLWITGSQNPGIYEIGVISGPLEEAAIDPDYLIDERRRDKPVWCSPFRMLSLEAYIAQSDMKNDPDLAGCEQFRIPIMSNPTYLTHRELDAVTQYVSAKSMKAAGWTTRLKKLGGKS